MCYDLRHVPQCRVREQIRRPGVRSRQVRGPLRVLAPHRPSFLSANCPRHPTTHSTPWSMLGPITHSVCTSERRCQRSFCDCNSWKVPHWIHRNNKQWWQRKGSSCKGRHSHRWRLEKLSFFSTNKLKC